MNSPTNQGDAIGHGASAHPRVLVIAFGLDPTKGSESGVGWSFGRIAASIGETWLLYRKEEPDPDELRGAVRAMPEGDRLHLIPISQPYLAGHAPTTADWRWERVEYLLWQLRALRIARRIAKRERIDIVWHVSWSTVWLGSIGGLIGPKFVWGPVGGGVGAPWPVLGSLGLRGAAVEIARSLTRATFRWLNPLVRHASSRADLILAQNVETVAWLPPSVRGRTEVFHHIAVTDVPPPGECPPRGERPPTALFAGRLLTWKGAWLAIDAIAQLDGWRLIICGEGPDEANLRVRASRRGLDGRVEFRGHTPRPELLRMMRDEVDVFLFPSLHDEGGWVVGEALASGLPVVCVDRGGPPSIAGHGVKLTAQGTASRLAQSLVATFDTPTAIPPAPLFETRRAALIELLRKRGLVGTTPTDQDGGARPIVDQLHHGG